DLSRSARGFFLPENCGPGGSCSSACVALIGTLPQSGTLFTCRVAIEPNAPPATYPLTCSVTTPVAASCTDGSVIVTTVLPGDCNGDGQVTIDELILGVNIALGTEPISACPAFDTHGDGQGWIDEPIAAVNVALNQ